MQFFLAILTPPRYNIYATTFLRLRYDAAKARYMKSLPPQPPYQDHGHA